MKTLHVKPVQSFHCEIADIAPDKSISHRAALFSLLSSESSKITNFLQGEDTLCMLNIVKQLGAKVQRDGGSIVITPPQKIKEPKEILYCGNAGTAIRLLMGFLATKRGFFVLNGDKYLNSRPMRRIANPLRDVGAKIDGRSDGEFSPLAIRGSKLKSFKYESEIPSAQLKSALILAALDLDSPSVVSEKELSRDHTEKMLSGMGVKIEKQNNSLTIYPPKKPLKPLDIHIPADPSSGFFFAVAAVIIPGSQIVLKNMLLNPTRVEAYRVLQKMGADIEFIKKESKYEDIGDIKVSYSELQGVEVSENIPWLIDEIPALAIAFSQAKGKSVVKNAKELRVKESDRISTTVTNLQKCGIEVEEYEDGFAVVGGELQEALVESFGDHRIAMSFLIAGLKCGMQVVDTECIETSFPNFTELLKRLEK